MSYLKELVQNAERTDGFMGRRKTYYEKLEKKSDRNNQQVEEKSGFSRLLLFPLVAVGGYILWYYFRRY